MRRMVDGGDIDDLREMGGWDGTGLREMGSWDGVGLRRLTVGTVGKLSFGGS